MGDFPIVLGDFVDVLQGDLIHLLRSQSVSLAKIRDRLLRSSDQVTRVIIRNPTCDPQILRILIEVLKVVICAQGA